MPRRFKAGRIKNARTQKSSFRAPSVLGKGGTGIPVAEMLKNERNVQPEERLYLNPASGALDRMKPVLTDAVAIADSLTVTLVEGFGPLNVAEINEGTLN